MGKGTNWGQIHLGLVSSSLLGSQVMILGRKLVCPKLNFPITKLDIIYKGEGETIYNYVSNVLT